MPALLKKRMIDEINNLPTSIFHANDKMINSLVPVAQLNVLPSFHYYHVNVDTPDSIT